MELLHLRVLREVARRGSISAAADALDYTQPAVSRQLAILERQTGQALVERTPRGARLTSSGEALLRHAEDILARVDAARDEMEAIATLRGGRVRVSAFPSAIGSFVPSGLRAFGERHPDVQVGFRVAEAGPAIELLQRGAVDVAVTSLGLAGGPPPGLRAHALIDDPFLLALPPDHPLADLAEVPVAALAGEQLIIGNPSTCPDCEVMLLACQDHGFVPDRSYAVDDYGAVLGLVSAGLAAAMVPQLALTGPRTDVVIRPLDAHLVRHIVAMTVDGPGGSAADEAMVAALADAAAAHRVTGARAAGVPAGA
ncbi:LysR family transcriptional regulator [Patulibacter sp.]|uniref:LysR family transcriptional regulator n=1 Tax=Patulibacter sp. TaxID=1912859 RepID=UPI002725B88B|nr:LysR family transcriptional regulator [Patulibacter sp.]MDO9409468.1 LysR family transcriptional regulator [Patulibacter sp.]